MPSPILARADALMQRRRLNAEIDDVPVLTDAVGEDDDIPVLLDIETFDTAQESEPEAELQPELALPPENITQEAVTPPPLAAQEMPRPAALDAGIRDILAHELARRVEQRLAAELPRLIESTVRDFLAEQEMIAAMQPRD